ncbi:MAG TPA: IPT/TIG domain-containing protein, partial [Blastocatellia bacterium]
MTQPVIEKLLPCAGVEGGEVVISCKDFEFGAHDQARVTFDGVDARPISASLTRVVAAVPSGFLTGDAQVAITANG